jgi:TonB family protein
VWYLARSWDGASRWNPAVLAALHTAVQARTAGDSSLAVRLAAELVARHQGVPPSTSREWQTVLSSADSTMRFLVERPFAISVMSTKELDMAGEPFLTTAKELRDNLTRKPLPTPPAAPKSALSLPAIEAASGYPPEFATDVFNVTGCRLADESDRTKSDGAAGGIVTLREHGRPASVAPLTARIAQPACLTAASILVATAVAPRVRDETPTEKTVLVPFDSEFFACQEAYHRRPGTPSAEDGDEPWRTTGRTQLGKAPTKVKNVPPVYPNAAQQEGVQGIVIMEAAITHEGCVSRARVLRGVDGRLDWAALRAVLQWKFAPTVLDGVPVPVLLTVTVQFTLR